jgi:isopenicillin N synthase-like dioxygenase
VRGCAGDPAGVAAHAWIIPTVPDAFIVNGGQLLLRWTNDRFLATPHCAVNRTDGKRYALAFFCDTQIDWPIAAVPTCVGPGVRLDTRRPIYMIRYQARTYNVFDNQAKDAAK